MSIARKRVSRRTLLTLKMKKNIKRSDETLQSNIHGAVFEWHRLKHHRFSMSDTPVTIHLRRGLRLCQ